MKTFEQQIAQLEQFKQIKEQLNKKCGLHWIDGCTDSGRLHFSYTLSEDFKKHIIVTYNEIRAREIFEEFSSFDKNTVYYPAKDVMFFAADLHGNLLVVERMKALKAIIMNENVTVVTTADALMNMLLPIEEIKEKIIHLDSESVISIEELEKRLVMLGYERTYQAENPGQFAVRGGIVDVYGLTDENPCRIEFWGDEIDLIKSYDAESQRTIENLMEVDIFPACEVIADEDRLKSGIDKIKKDMQEVHDVFRKKMKTEEAYRIKTSVNELLEMIENNISSSVLDSYLMYFTDKAAGFLDYFDFDNTLITLDEPVRIGQRIRAVELEFSSSMENRLSKGYAIAGQAKMLRSAEEVFALLSRHRGVGYFALDNNANEFEAVDRISVVMHSVPSYSKDFSMLLKELKKYKQNDYKILLYSMSKTRAKRLSAELIDNDLMSFYTDDECHEIKPGEIMTACGHVRSGYECPENKFVVISENDIFGQKRLRKKKKKKYEGSKISSFNELKVGDYVVHENHGLGIYKGIEKVEIDKVLKDYVKIEYADGGSLFVLATQLDAIQKYASVDAKPPKLNRLGGKEWTKTRKKVQTAVEEIAKDLVELYAARANSQGYEFSEDNVWQQEFEEMFPYEETPDQLAAIDATKRDMESKKVMDRLVCGDVGFGKTEIAIRAAFKAVQDSKQVVYLVPTTILAQQHYETFKERMKNYPVSIELLCRFRTPAQQKESIERIKRGTSDILIGTHRVLSKDISFKDLGLLIIDEEQRFGVNHKEKIKKLKENVDVLTLSATPIPRTLHMSLVGIRDMSVLEEAPSERVPIQTYVMEYNEEMIREAISRELARDGQVYYVFNKVNQIEEMASKIASLVPEARVEFAHGQMKEHQLEEMMMEFVNHEIDVLVSTTIIETGLDISNVNTIIIHDAENFGLSQLYQLRGRVGRSNRTAYAFLMYRRNKMLTEVAQKRLEAIKDFTELGSGIKIAMRDLELRGAGNILGKSQHGHMEAVGYDLYCKMLNMAVKKEKGEEVSVGFETNVEINVDAYIPDRYIPNEFQKLDIYKRIAELENEDECEDMRDELTDRFGDIPKAVENLLRITMVKVHAHELYMTSVEAKKEYVRFSMYEKAEIQTQKIPEVIEMYPKELTFRAESKPYFIYKLKKNKKGETENAFEAIEKLLQDMQILR